MPRPRGSRSRRARHALVLRAAAPLLALPLLRCGVSAPSPAAETARAWGNGPTRWLLLPEDTAALEAVRTNAEFAHFLAGFWDCRDDDPSTGDNPVARRFAERVEAADRLYGERHLRGSLTDRGRALVLLGPPSMLHYSERRTPALEGTTAGGGRATRLLKVEVWGYHPADLPPPLRARLAPNARDDEELAVTFLVSEKSARLLEGDDLLTDAARALARCRQ